MKLPIEIEADEITERERFVDRFAIPCSRIIWPIVLIAVISLWQLVRR